MLCHDLMMLAPQVCALWFPLLPGICSTTSTVTEVKDRLNCLHCNADMLCDAAQLEGVLAGLGAVVPPMHQQPGVAGQVRDEAEALPEDIEQHMRLPEGHYDDSEIAHEQPGGSRASSAEQEARKTDDGRDGNGEWAADLRAGVPLQVSLTIDAG